MTILLYPVKNYSEFRLNYYRTHTNEFVSDRWIENIKDEYHNKFENVVLTCYFNQKMDPQWNVQRQTDDYQYIKPWYDSMKKTNMHGIIFYDNLSENFIKKYETDKIFFKKCKYGKFSLNDERFILYFLYLKQNPYKQVFMTDVSDVTINKNPFLLISNPEKLYVGSDEPKLLKDSTWCQNKANTLFTAISKKYKGIDAMFSKFIKMPCYNAGVIGGYHNMVLFLLESMTHIFYMINNDNNNNMMVLNFVIYMRMLYDYKFDIQINRSTTHIMCGYPLTSEFKKYQTNSRAYILHK